MSRPRFTVAGGRRKPSRVHRGWRHRIRFEQLEDRRLLASDFLNSSALNSSGLAEAEGTAQQVAVHLSTTDLAGNPISSVSAGQRFLLQASVEDLRADSPGVFAAYIDVGFNPSQVAVWGPVVHAAGFLNGLSGGLGQPGLIDEAGGFGTSLFPPGVAVADLFSVLVTADTVGQVVFESRPADILPEHAVLLYGVDTQIPNSTIDFGQVAIEVTAFEGASDVVAFDDTYDVLAGSAENRLDVLLNDAGYGELVVSGIDAAGVSGVVSIAPDGHGLLYAPAPDFVGTEQFSYVAMDENGISDDAIVTVTVNAVNSGDDVVSIRLEATDLLGTPIASVAEGGEFLLNAYVEDTRADAQGVFATYLDLLYSSSLIEPSGEIAFGSQLANGKSGDLATPGIVDEVGSFQQSIHPVLGGESLLFTIPFSATAAGQAVFQSDPADVLPAHAVLVYGNNEPIPDDRIAYGGLILDVVSEVVAVDDSFHVPVATTVELDVLGNDLHRSDDALRILDVDASLLRGTVLVAADGSTLFYTPELGFAGTEQFTYLAEGSRGVDSAQVTVHTAPVATGDEVLAIDLATTDLAGNPISSIEAGQEFWLTASVEDLRDASLADLGVFAAFFDLLYDAEHVAVVASDAHRLGFDVTFGTEYQNGQQGRATVPGIIDEIGSFQSSLNALGADPQDLFAVRLRANSASGNADTFVVQEDVRSFALDVLANDTPNAGTTFFRSDPSDVHPISDVLLFQPPEVVEPTGIRFGETSLQIVGGATPSIAAVGRTSQGGSVVISADRQRLEYTPAPDFFGVETFTYTMEQGPTVDVEVVVEAMPDAPEANDDSYRIRANRSLTIDAPQGPLANDSDADGDSLEAVAIAGPAHGTLEIADNGGFVYVPEPDYFGLDQFTYRAFDGGLVSNVATVDILVEPPPVRIRLEVVDASGAVQSEVTAGETVFLQALVQDLRDAAQPIHGVGAAYLDVGYDPAQVTPVTVENGEFDVAIDFGDLYQNGRTVHTDVAGLVDDVGAFQGGFAPLGADELELFTIQMQLAALQAVDDEFTLSGNSRVNSLDVLANELGLTWDVPFDAMPAGNGPLTDVVLYDPPVVVDPEDIAFVDTAVTVRNGVDLTILSAGLVGSSFSENGGTVAVVDGGTRIEYVPPPAFLGIDTFEYTVVDANGATATAKVRVDVVQSWQNRLNRFDVNSDGLVTSADVLALLNELNRNGARELPTAYLGPHFFDVNGDGFLSPQDVLAVINRINERFTTLAETQAEGEAPADLSSELVVDRLGTGLIPWGLGQRLRPAQRENDFKLAPSPWHRQEIDSPSLLVSPSVSADVQRLSPAADRIEPRDASDLGNDELLDGLDQLADDVARIWAMER